MTQISAVVEENLSLVLCYPKIVSSWSTRIWGREIISTETMSVTRAREHSTESLYVRAGVDKRGPGFLLQLHKFNFQELT